MAWRIGEHESIGLLPSQISPPSPQPSARRQCVNTLPTDPPATEPAANQDAPINKDSKSPNPRSLKQHTPAESIPPFSFCFYPAREIGRSPIQISRCLLQPIEVKVLNKVLNKVLILVAFAYILCLRTPSPGFAFTSQRLPHLPWDFQLQSWPATHLRVSLGTPWQCRPVGGMGYSLRDEAWRREGDSVTSMPWEELRLNLILSAGVHMGTSAI